MSPDRFCSPVLRCLDFSFSFETDDAELGEFVTSLYCRTATPPMRRFAIAGPTLSADGQPIIATDTRSILLARLVWEINRGAERLTDHELLLHAGAVEIGGSGVLLPAAQNSGKSTLVAALVARGARYLTDELVAYDASTGTMRGAVKPITLEAGSWSVVPECAPKCEHLAAYFTTAWQVSPFLFGSDAVVTSIAPRLIVSPRYEPGTRARFEPLTGAQAAMLLSEQSFNFHTHGAAALHATAVLVRDAERVVLSFDAIDEACALVQELATRRLTDVAGRR